MGNKDEEGLLVYGGAVLEKRARHTKKPLNFPVARDEMVAAFISYLVGLVLLALLSALSKYPPAHVPHLLAEVTPMLLLAWLTPIPAFVVYEIYTSVLVGRSP